MGEIYIESGRFQGKAAPDLTLTLRIDVAEEPAANRVSGEIWNGPRPLVAFRGERFHIEEARGRLVSLRGGVRFSANRAFTSLSGTLELTYQGPRPSRARLHVTSNDLNGMGRVIEAPLRWISPFFRQGFIEVERVRGTTFPPPLTGTGRVITLPSILKAAGLEFRIQQGAADLPRNLEGEEAWHDGELHRTMVDRVGKKLVTQAPSFYLLVASRYADPGVYALAFDATLGGQGTAPDPRRGGVIFYDHPTLVEHRGHFEGAREFLFGAAHTLGHLLGLEHSAEKGRPDALSFMVAPENYPTGGERGFWKHFTFTFAADETAHLRHAPLLSAGEGGSGVTFAESDRLPLSWFDEATARQDDRLLLSLTPHKSHHAWGEPVDVTVKISNRSKEPVKCYPLLDPEDGHLRLFVRSPRGQVREFLPFSRRCRRGKPIALSPGKAIDHGLACFFDRRGFLFSEPGTYTLWATYRGLVTEVPTCLVSPPATLSVAYPLCKEDRAIADLVFGEEQGLILALGGARHLERGTEQLLDLVERYPRSPVAHYVAVLLGTDRGREFKDVKLKRVDRADHREAIRLIRRGLSRLTLNPHRYSRALLALGRSCLQEGLTDHARAHLEECIQLNAHRGGSRTLLRAQELAGRLPGASRKDRPVRSPQTRP